MKTTITSEKPTGVTADKKKAVASVADAPRTVIKPSTKRTSAKQVEAEQTAISVVQQLDQSTVAAQAVTADIAAQAYLLWEADGYQHGKHEEHWLKAEQLLTSKARK
jgi:hypothetical protein